LAGKACQHHPKPDKVPYNYGNGIRTITSTGRFRNRAAHQRMLATGNTGRASAELSLAQLDDYARTPRSRLSHTPPWTLQVRARASSVDLPGTWGFGLWNDPFGLSLGFGGGKPLRLPTLPQTAWFMQASRPNWLSLRDDPERVSRQWFLCRNLSLTHTPSSSSGTRAAGFTTMRNPPHLAGATPGGRPFHPTGCRQG